MLYHNTEKSHIDDIILPKILQNISHYSVSLWIFETKVVNFEGLELKTWIEWIKEFLRWLDEHTFIHSCSVSNLAISFAPYIGIWWEDLALLQLWWLMHDSGKRILKDLLIRTSNRRMTEEEYQMIKNHTVWWFMINRAMGLPVEVQDIALYHHKYFQLNWWYPNIEEHPNIDLPIWYRSYKWYVMWQIIWAMDHLDSAHDPRRWTYQISTLTQKTESVINEFWTVFDPSLKEPFVKWVTDYGYL